MSKELPYIFDLLWDVKTYEQVERIAKFEGDCSSARPYDLVELFQKENLEIPECLKGFVQKDDTNNVVMKIYGVYDVWYRTSYSDDYQIDEYFQTKESALAYGANKGLTTSNIDDWLVEIEVKP